MKTPTLFLACLIGACATSWGQDVFDARLQQQINLALFGETLPSITVRAGVAYFQIEGSNVNYRLALPRNYESSDSDTTAPDFSPVITSDDFEYSFPAGPGNPIAIGGCDTTPANPFLPFRFPVPSGTGPDGEPIYLTCHAIGFWWDYSGSIELPPEGIAALQSGKAVLRLPSDTDTQAEGVIAIVPEIPKLENLSAVNGRFTLSAIGQFKTKAVLERSEDLNAWTPVLTNDRPFQVSFPISADSAREFYRVVESGD